MITSMTGFGVSKFENDSLSLHAQVKSVNGRFLETRFRLPRQYSSLENEIKKMVSQLLQRGSVDISLNRVSKNKSGQVKVEANSSLAKAWLETAKQLATDLHFDASKVSFESILRVPDVIAFSENEELSDEEKKLVLATIDEAVKNCLAERKREGEDQYKTFSSLLSQLDTFIKTVENKKVSIDQELQHKLKERLKNLEAEIAVEPNRLAQEALIIRDRADIAEEIARATAHIAAYKKALKENGSIGKKLEFYTQELHREVNTMGSKTQSLGVTLDIIEAKTVVERLREQVQNVE